MGFTQPTPIQASFVPAALGDESAAGVAAVGDLVGLAPTGTGKTIAYGIPLADHLLKNKPVETGGRRRDPRNRLRAIVLVPTRELAQQVAEELQLLTRGSLLRVLAAYGKVSLLPQKEALAKGVDIVVATPGRARELIELDVMTLAHVERFVCDEADRMLDMGFLPQIQRIISKVPKKRQTLLFSATMSDAVATLAYKFMHEPGRVEASPVNVTAGMVNEVVYPVAAASKIALLVDLVEKNDWDKVLVFTKTKRAAETLTHILTAREVSADQIHADRSQGQRERALKDFKSGKTRVLVATDIASRGIDVESVSHVINYEVPDSPEDYVHRVGRTGRAGNSGDAITFVSPAEEIALKAIEKLTGKKVERVMHEEFGLGSPSQEVPKSSGVKSSPKPPPRPFGRRRR
jgi:ATP-dependent RNA helicase RhlE